jgi:hypothetical protein
MSWSIFFILAYIIFLFFSPVDTNSTSYKLGRGTGDKCKRGAEWLMKTKDD